MVDHPQERIRHPIRVRQERLRDKGNLHGFIVAYGVSFGRVMCAPKWGTMDLMRTILRIALSVLASLTAAFLIALPAQAHTQLVGVDPAEGATVEAGDVVTLTFSSALLDLGAEASVTDSTGTVTAAAVDLSQAGTLIVTIPEVAAGDATLSWRIVAEDGHPIEGTLAYVAAAPPAPEPSEPSEEPTASASAAPVVTDIAATETPSPAPSGESGDANSGVSVAVWVAIAVALAAALFGTMTAARRRAGGTQNAESPGTDDTEI